jgi:hypothetical protein
MNTQGTPFLIWSNASAYRGSERKWRCDKPARVVPIDFSNETQPANNLSPGETSLVSALFPTSHLGFDVMIQYAIDGVHVKCRDEDLERQIHAIRNEMFTDREGKVEVKMVIGVLRTKHSVGKTVYPRRVESILIFKDFVQHLMLQINGSAILPGSTTESTGNKSFGALKKVCISFWAKVLAFSINTFHFLHYYELDYSNMHHNLASRWTLYYGTYCTYENLSSSKCFLEALQFLEYDCPKCGSLPGFYGYCRYGTKSCLVAASMTAPSTTPTSGAKGEAKPAIVKDLAYYCKNQHEIASRPAAQYSTNYA